LAFLTFGISWLIYPFFARRIVETNYLRKGWVPVNLGKISEEAPQRFAATTKSQGGSRPWIRGIIALAAITLLLAIASWPTHTLTIPTPVTSPPIASTATPPAHVGSGNVADDLLMALPKNQQAAMLGQAVGEGCNGTAAFRMGKGKPGNAKDSAFWSVRCSNGKAYAVQIAPDSMGSTTVLECSLLKATVGTACFKKFPN
jgi:hypothetical protein